VLHIVAHCQFLWLGVLLYRDGVCCCGRVSLVTLALVNGASLTGGAWTAMGSHSVVGLSGEVLVLAKAPAPWWWSIRVGWPLTHRAVLKVAGLWGRVCGGLDWQWVGARSNVVLSLDGGRNPTLFQATNRLTGHHPSPSKPRRHPAPQHSTPHVAALAAYPPF
jgi:hypothetical protein